jgi:hypothetical protein
MRERARCLGHMLVGEIPVIHEKRAASGRSRSEGIDLAEDRAEFRKQVRADADRVRIKAGHDDWDGAGKRRSHGHSHSIVAGGLDEMS